MKVKHVLTDWQLAGIVAMGLTIPLLRPVLSAADEVSAPARQPAAKPTAPAGKTSRPTMPNAGAPPSEDDKLGVAAARWLEQCYAGQPQPEAVRMLVAIAKGSMMGPNEGWFGDSQSRFAWQWLADRHKIDVKSKLTRDKFLGPGEFFDRLDRSRDGALSAEDFDWSEKSPLVRQQQQISPLFRRIDQSSDGRITGEEWKAAFDALRAGKDYLTPEDLAQLLQFPKSQGAGPSPMTLVKGLFNQELGSFHEGPAVGAPAPDFALKTQDGKKSITLSSLRNQKPVVLIFGSFT